MRWIKKYDFTSNVMLAWTCLCLLLHQLLYLIPPLLLTPSVPPFVLYLPRVPSPLSILLGVVCLWALLFCLFVLFQVWITVHLVQSRTEWQLFRAMVSCVCACAYVCYLCQHAIEWTYVWQSAVPPPGSGVGVSSAAGAKSSEVRRNPPT